jgi:hypothetical protein
MATSVTKKADRIFVRNGRRHYRRRFNAAEPRAGIVLLVALAAVVGWIAWKGAHPDPSLMMLETDLSQAGTAGAATAAPAERGPVPVNLAASGWTEGEISQFDYDNLYVKINGREGYYKSFGFEMLYFASIVAEENPQTVVDIELYDLGDAANAVGAYSGERSPGTIPQVGETGMKHYDRNAFYFTRGRYYLRAIGSEESPDVIAQLNHIENRFEAELPGESLPWGYALFVGRMGKNPGEISYAPENAFSFGFARRVYSVVMEGETELFVTPADTEAGAEELAGRFMDGFRNYGSDEGEFVRDRYRGTYAMATAAGPWVIGFLRATDTAAALEALAELADAVADMPLPEEPAEEPPAEPEEENFGEDYGSDEY